MEMSPHPVSASPRTTWTAERPAGGCAGNRSTASSNNGRPVSAQLLANAPRSPFTAGPRTRTTVSRHWDASLASPSHWSAMPNPPLKATSPSQINTLRWPRCEVCVTRQLVRGRNHSTCAPAEAMRPMRSLSMPPRPSESSSTLTRTPARARSLRAPANRSPTDPAQCPKVDRSTVARAAATASSMAGRIRRPLRRTSTRLASVAGTPTRVSRAQRGSTACSAWSAAIGPTLRGPTGAGPGSPGPPPAPSGTRPAPTTRRDRCVRPAARRRRSARRGPPPPPGRTSPGSTPRRGGASAS